MLRLTSFLSLNITKYFYLFACIAPIALAIELNAGLLAYVEEKFGTDARLRLVDWQKLANTNKALPELEQVSLVNDFFNQRVFISDIKHWGREDYWATPVEMLITNAGDCEDYSIAKYFTLKDMGISEEKMRITYVKALTLNQAHMVLAYYPTPDADPLILDNLNKQIKPASARTDLAPVYSFNGEGLWLSRLRGQGKRIGNADKLDRWMDVNKRLLNELK
ncbi:BTLCP family transglutaminase-like cysteine proteinase [Oleiphilus messinensis]|uniref:BTLCP family transglutaminase-like cysteine proteinase n=1 Tax=Oleiphilus messinensis TaxID=141451 RepID=A0A1Y0I8Q1_9GAMM|nr:transglutaminase-like cysteine peptidase [Oleiphilus messinensis]ARU56887.1 BTLCP family transglutaminase-like cysteine proteinase [Oleiphilus messinensis]